MQRLSLHLVRGSERDPGVLSEVREPVFQKGARAMTGRVVELDEGYLLQVRAADATPVMCWSCRDRLCSDNCAAFRIETHMDVIDGVSRDVRYAHCAALLQNGRAAAIGRIDG